MVWGERTKKRRPSTRVKRGEWEDTLKRWSSNVRKIRKCNDNKSGDSMRSYESLGRTGIDVTR